MAYVLGCHAASRSRRVVARVMRSCSARPMMPVARVRRRRHAHTTARALRPTVAQIAVTTGASQPAHNVQDRASVDSGVSTEEQFELIA